MTYEDYLKTAYWKRTRAAIIRQYHYTCHLCGLVDIHTNYLHVHHRWYPPWFTEHRHPLCLVVLCRPCHKRTQKKMELKNYERSVV